MKLFNFQSIRRTKGFFIDLKKEEEANLVAGDLKTAETKAAKIRERKRSVEKACYPAWMRPAISSL